MDAEFTGCVALVTGAGSGIGAGCAQVLARRGARVLVTDVIAQAAEQVAEKIMADGGEARAERVDVKDPASLEAAVRTAVARYGKLDLAVNNAGISSDRTATGEF